MMIKPDWYVLSMEEFMILASGIGIDRLYGMETKAAAKLGREAYLQQIFQMTKKGWLISKDSYMEMSGEMKTIFQGIRDAIDLLVCYPQDMHMPVRCFYCGSEITVVENSAVDNGKMRVCSVGCEDVYNDLIQQTYFPEGLPSSDFRREDNSLKKAFDGMFPSAEQVLKQEGTWLVMDSVNPFLGEVAARLCIIDHPLGYELIYQENEEEREFCQRKQILYYLERMTGGSIHDNG